MSPEAFPERTLECRVTAGVPVTFKPVVFCVTVLSKINQGPLKNDGAPGGTVISMPA